MNYNGKQDLKLKPQSNDTLGYISISIFWLSLLLWGFPYWSTVIPLAPWVVSVDYLEYWLASYSLQPLT